MGAGSSQGCMLLLQGQRSALTAISQLGHAHCGCAESAICPSGACCG